MCDIAGSTHDVFTDYVSSISVSKLAPKVFGCVAYVHMYPHQWRDRGSELESLGLENLGLELHNDIFEDVLSRRKIPGHTRESDRSPQLGVEDGALCEETTSRHLELDRLTESGDDKIALCEETTGRQPRCD
ncbi:unnamed protein product [Prunus armeniaca]